MFITFLFYNETATTEIYTYLHTLSLLDALPIYVDRDHLVPVDAAAGGGVRRPAFHQVTERHAGDTFDDFVVLYAEHAGGIGQAAAIQGAPARLDRKSTRLNSSH